MIEVITSSKGKSLKVYKINELILNFLKINRDLTLNVCLYSEIYNFLNHHIYYPFSLEKVGLSDWLKTNTVVQQMFYSLLTKELPYFEVNIV